MPGIIEGYSYDIFISYRQKDNKYDGWVTEFVDNLKKELEATFKEDISVYFDINPHNGLLETHDVDASLKEKLKCLIFIPILSRTYCDPKAFAWEHEFRAFIDQASKDRIGMKVKLPGGNVAGRVLPVLIHELDPEDIKLCEAELGGFLRGIELIYKEPGVNRPLTPNDDESRNLNKTKYRNQINKVANAVREIITGLKQLKRPDEKGMPDARLPWEEAGKEKRNIPEEKKKGIRSKKNLVGTISLLTLAVISVFILFPGLFRKDSLERLRSSREKLSVAVFPFSEPANDTLFDIWAEVIQTNLINSLSLPEELIVRDEGTIGTLIQKSSISGEKFISPSSAEKLSEKLETDIYLYGTIQKIGSDVQITVLLSETNSKNILKSFLVNLPYSNKVLLEITDSLSKIVTDFLLLSRLIRTNPGYDYSLTKSFKALQNYIYGMTAIRKGNRTASHTFFEKAIALDSSFHMAALMNAQTAATRDEHLWWLTRNYMHRDQMPPVLKYQAAWAYAYNFESPEKRLEYLKLVEGVSGQTLWVLNNMAIAYGELESPLDKIILFEKYLEKARKFGKEYLTEVPHIYKQLAEAYSRTGQYKKALKILKMGRQYCPDSYQYTEYILYQAAFTYKLNKPARGKKYFEEYVKVAEERARKANGNYPGTDLAEDTGWLFFFRGMSDSANYYFEKSRRMEEPVYNTERWNRLTLISRPEDIPDLDKYLGYLDPLIAFSKKSPNRYNYLDYKMRKGYAYFLKGVYPEALKILQEVYDEAPYKLYRYKVRLEEVKKAIEAQERKL